MVELHVLSSKSFIGNDLQVSRHLQLYECMADADAYVTNFVSIS